MILKENIWKTAIAMMSQLQQAQGEMFLGTDLGSASPLTILTFTVIGGNVLKLTQDQHLYTQREQ